MTVTKEQVEAFAKELTALASIFAPTEAMAVASLVTAASQLNTMIQNIKNNDPDMWSKVSAETNEVVAQYEAGLPK